MGRPDGREGRDLEGAARATPAPARPSFGERFAGEVVLQVNPDGRIAWSGIAGPAVGRDGAERTLPEPRPGDALVDWLVAAAGRGRAGGPGPEPVALPVHASPGDAGLLVTAGRLPSAETAGGGLRPASPPRGRLRRLVGFKRRRTFLFDPARVLTFELRSGLVQATFDDGETLTTNYTVGELAVRLGPLGFFRAHRDVVVNLKRVKEIERIGQGRLRLLLDGPDAHGVTASRPASARLRRLLGL